MMTFVKSERCFYFKIEAPFLFSEKGKYEDMLFLEGRRMVMDRKVVRIC